MQITVGIVEDHKLVLKSLEMIINSFPHLDVVLSAESGGTLFSQLEQSDNVPDILLLDVVLPDMNGYEIALRLRKNYPAVKIAALSALDDSMNVVKMIKAGCCTYLHKNMDLEEFGVALKEIWQTGYYNSFLTNMCFQESNLQRIELREREIEFLKLVCTDLTYYEIADYMCLSIKTIDGYRAALFDKFKVRNRIGLVLEVFRHNLIAFA